jgi:hypothetical protein
MLSRNGPLGSSSFSRVGEVFTKDHDDELAVGTFSVSSDPAMLDEDLADDDSTVPDRRPR